MAKNLIVFKPEQPILEVMELLIKHRISGGPVVNDQYELVGMVSEADCIKQISESRYFNLPMHNTLVVKFMSTDYQTINDNISIFEAANIFCKKGSRRRLPVLKDNKLIGQISRKDILKAVLKLKGQSWKY